jgi:hypothetical protein
VRSAVDCRRAKLLLPVSAAYSHLTSGLPLRCCFAASPHLCPSSHLTAPLFCSCQLNCGQVVRRHHSVLLAPRRRHCTRLLTGRSAVPYNSRLPDCWWCCSSNAAALLPRLPPQLAGPHDNVAHARLHFTARRAQQDAGGGGEAAPLLRLLPGGHDALLLLLCLRGRVQRLLVGQRRRLRDERRGIPARLQR